MGWGVFGEGVSICSTPLFGLFCGYGVWFALYSVVVGAHALGTHT
jgi:hypothetical protein